MSYDPHCEDLARLFLEDRRRPSETLVQQLAQRLQDTIEAFIEGEPDGEEAREGDDQEGT